ncbi:hypothetical protein B0H14DRAFT_2590723 [Mycena olivaceomarginata]|nr:hypothetical protein B0H14DRAFT_2590723 [Mycena olivaceomarginata]
MHYAQFFPPIFPILAWGNLCFYASLRSSSEFEFLPHGRLLPYQLPFPLYAPFNSKGEFVPSSADARNAPPSFIPHPRNVTASESSISTSLAQEDSAFNCSATNPYNYPMTQICIVYLTCRTKFLFLGDDAIHSSNTFDHTGTHGGNHGCNFHTFGLIGVQDCGIN